MERRNARREREAGMDGGFMVAPVTDEDDNMSLDEDKTRSMSEKEKKKLLDARALIKAGMGSGQGKEDSGFEVVPRVLPIADTR
eukprot:scaffold11287_cov62-Alexandrium_tamarense.AAC.1